MFMRRKVHFHQKITIFFALLLLISFFVLLFIDRNIKPIVFAMAEGQVRIIAIRAMNDAVYEIMGHNLKYTDLINVLQDKDGKISMLQANTVRMNELGSRTALQSQKNINEVGSQTIKIPLGSVFGGQLLAGRGPLIRVRIVPVGSVNTEFVTEFENAGINQSRHKIYLKVKTQIGIVVPTGSEKIEVSSQVPIAETIIVGNVPNSYVNVDETNKMLNLIPRDN